MATNQKVWEFSVRCLDAENNEYLLLCPDGTEIQMEYDLHDEYYAEWGCMNLIFTLINDDGEGELGFQFTDNDDALNYECETIVACENQWNAVFRPRS